MTAIAGPLIVKHANGNPLDWIAIMNVDLSQVLGLPYMHVIQKWTRHQLWKEAVYQYLVAMGWVELCAK